MHVEMNWNDSVSHVKQKKPNLSDSGISESLNLADQMQEGKAKSFKTWYVIEGTSYSSVRV